MLVFSDPDLCGDEEQSSRAEGLIHVVKTNLGLNDSVYEVKDTFSITQAQFG